MGSLRRTAVVSFLITPLFVAGCAGGDPAAAPGSTASGGGSTPATATTGPTPATTAPGSTTPPSSTARPPRPSGPVITLGPPPTVPLPPGTFRPPGKMTSVVGEVVEGVEAGCYLLRVSGGKDLLLIGASLAQLRVGGRVRVTGRAEPDLITTCQQGTPFIVSDVSPA
jgi:hypothetical protein